MKFTLEIELGNDAMRTGADVAEVLERLAHHMGTRNWAALSEGECQHVHDLNGNTVGKWEVAD